MGATDVQRLPADPAPVLRRVRPEDWPALRALRLEALRDTPIGFLERAGDAEQLPDANWQARARRGAAGGDSCQLMAFDGERPVATSVGFLRDGAAWLAAVYVTPDRRGQGLLGRLVDRLVDRLVGWARGQGVGELRLQVHEDNARACRAYVRLGFRRTGEREPYPLDPARDELVMVCEL